MATKLFVGNLSYQVDDTIVRDWFRPYGGVKSAKVMIDRDSGRSKGFAFVEMATDDEAEAAIRALNGVEMAGRRLNVGEARPPRPHNR